MMPAAEVGTTACSSEPVAGLPQQTTSRLPHLGIPAVVAGALRSIRPFRTVPPSRPLTDAAAPRSLLTRTPGHSADLTAHRKQRMEGKRSGTRTRDNPRHSTDIEEETHKEEPQSRTQEKLQRSILGTARLGPAHSCSSSAGAYCMTWLPRSLASTSNCTIGSHVA
jgi:hypothetical protein